MDEKRKSGKHNFVFDDCVVNINDRVTIILILNARRFLLAVYFPLAKLPYFMYFAVDYISHEA